MTQINSQKGLKRSADRETLGIDQQEWMSAVLEVRPLNTVGYHGLTRQTGLRSPSAGARRAPARLAVVDQSSYITLVGFYVLRLFQKTKGAALLLAGSRHLAGCSLCCGKLRHPE